MDIPTQNRPSIKRLGSLPPNVWAVGLTSFFNDIASEMVLNLLPLFLANVLGVKTSIIGLIEGVAESTASILKLFSGWLSDRLEARKWPAVLGYGLSALTRPLFFFANSWGIVAGVRWADRVGKGIRTAPRDALVADSVSEQERGLAFGFHRAADTAGALVGLIIALAIVSRVQYGGLELSSESFQMVVLASLVPGGLAVLALVLGTQEVRVKDHRAAPRFAFKSLGRRFVIFIIIVSLFELGNSSDAFLVLRAQERGLSVSGVLTMLIVFNFTYTLVSIPAGSVSDRIGRRKVIVGGWLIFAAVYLGFGLAQTPMQIRALYAVYGLYYGMAAGASRALIADLVPEALRGTAYGTYNAAIGILDLPASVIAGLLWQGAGRWGGFGPSAPFLFGAFMAVVAAVLLAAWLPKQKTSDR